MELTKTDFDWDNMIKNLLAVFFVFTLFTGCQTTTKRLNLPELQTVEKVDIVRYMGKWYEIARLPAWFQKGCTGSTATYSLQPDSKVKVVNRCFKDRLNGEIKEAIGVAVVEDTTSNSKLKVSFFRPFWGEYWIIILDENYQYAVVGHPSRDYLWILNRESKMNIKIYEKLIAELESVGYETNKLIKTTHPDISGE